MKNTHLMYPLIAVSETKFLNSCRIASLLLLVFIFFINISAKAQCETWNPVGTSVYVATGAGFASMATDRNGTPYVAYSDFDAGLGRLTVKKYNGSAWVLVGDPTSPAYYSNETAIAIDDNGTAYVAFYDIAVDHMSVVKYDGTSWVYVGAPGFTGEAAGYIHIAIDGSGIPYVAYYNWGTDHKATVMKFNGSNWVNVGPSHFTPDYAGLDRLVVTRDGTLYMTFQNSFEGYSVMTYNGSDWVYVGATYDGGYDIALDGSGTPYVLYADLTSAGKAAVRKYNGSSWVNVGSPGFSAASINDGLIAIDKNGMPYVLYLDSAVAGRTTVMKYNGTSWVTAGNAGFSTTSMSAYEAYSHYFEGTFAMGSDGNPYVLAATDSVIVNKLSTSIAPVTGQANLCISTTTTLSDATGGGAWSSSNTAIATVGSGTGVVTGVAAGTAMISYTIGSCSAVYMVTVNSSASGGTITGINNICTIGAQTNLYNTITGGTWSSSNTSIATIGVATGIATGVATGTATMTYTVNNGCGSAAAVRILSVNIIPSSGTISGSLSVCTGLTTILSSTASGGTWSSSNTAVATANAPTGIITGVAAGTSIISYNMTSLCGSNTGMVTVTVNTSPDAGIITGPSYVNKGSAITLSDGVGGGTWSAGNSNATISGSGIVTGVNFGMVTISYTVTSGSCTTSTTSSIGITKTYSCDAWTLTGAIETSSSSSYFSSMALNNSGTPYVIFTDPENGNKATVKKLNGDTWDIVGSAGFSAGEMATGEIAIDGSGTPYVAYADSAYDWKLTVMKYNGSSWETVGSPGFSASEVGHDLFKSGGDIALAIDPTGHPYVAYNGLVQKYTGTYWTILGTSDELGVSASTYSLAFDAIGTPYLAYVLSSVWVPELLTYTSVCKVVRFDADNVAWSQVGTETFVTYNITPSALTIDHTGILRIAYPDVLNGQLVTVKKYIGTGWVTEGSEGFSISVADYVAMAIDNSNTPYVFYGGTSPAAVHKFDGTDWVIVGSVLLPNDGPHNYPGIAIDDTGKVYLSYSDWSNSTGIGQPVVTGMKHQAAPITSAAVGCYTTLSDATLGGTWSSSNTSVATVNTTDYVNFTPVTAVTPGTTVISYTAGSCSTSYVETVSPLHSITGPNAVCVGGTVMLTDTMSGDFTDHDWVSSDLSKLNLSAWDATSDGFQGVAPGTVTVYHYKGSCVSTYDVTVSVFTPAPITGNVPFAIGDSITLSDTTAGGHWVLGDMSTFASVGIDPSDGTIQNTVTVSAGLSSGTATISYVIDNGCTYIVPTVTVTVNPTADIITGTETVCVGSTTTLSDAATSGGTWTSSNTAVATIGISSGIVTGIAGGTAIITYTLPSTDIITAEVTVNPLPNAGTITGTATVCVGATTTLSDAASGGVWTSSNTTNATVNSSGVVTGVAAGTATISYTVTNGCGSASAIDIITVNPLANAGTITGTAIVCAGATTTLSDATSGGAWTSSNTANATVNSSGVVTGVASGTATISYTVTNGCGSASATDVVTVNGAPSAGSISGSSSVTVSNTITLTDGISGGVWTASNSNATVSSGGVVTGVTTGTVTISYTVTNSCGSNSATKVVSVNAATLSPITGTFNLCPGTTTTLSDATTGGSWTSSNIFVATIGVSTGVVTGVATGTVTITYSLAGNHVTQVVSINPLPAVITGANTVCLNATTTLTNTTGGGTWSSSNAGIAGIDAITGVVTGNATGTVTISYTVGTGCYKTMAMTVKPLPVAIAGNLQLCPGGTSTVTDATPNGVTWMSSNTSVATIGSVSGVITGIATGTATITYTINTGCSITAVASVNSLPPAITGTASLCAATTTTLSDATTGGTWSSSTTSVATVGSATGIVSGVNGGVANITYTAGAGCIVTRAVTVNALPNTITGTTTLCTGTTTALSDATTGGTWSSGTTAVATIGSTGIVTGVSTGTSMITYTLGTGCTRTTTVTVSGSLSSITGTPQTCIGITTTLSDATPGGTWSSSMASVATVNASGVVSGVASGTTIITYSLGTGCRAMVTLTVSPSVSSITGTPSVCVNATTALSDASGGGIWSSSNAALGTVDATTGVVTGIAAGTPTITYTIGSGCYRTLNVTVKALPGAISGNTALCTGGTSTFTDGTGTSWTSSNTSVATVGIVSGVVTGIGAGTATISFTGTTGCVAMKVVTVDVAPSITAISGASAVGVGNTTLFTDATPSGIWSSSNVSKATIDAGGVVTGVAVGAATISYTLTNGVCLLSVTHAITISAGRPGVAVTEEDAVGLFTVYPNPNTGSFTARASGAGTFTVYSLEGKEIVRYAIQQGDNSLSLSKELAAGIYMCRYNGNDGSTVTIRLVYKP